MVLFINHLSLATPFPKIVKNSIFLVNFHQQCSIFLEISETIVFFLQTLEGLTRGFKSFENAPKIMYSFNFLNNPLKFLWLWGPVGGRPLSGFPEPQLEYLKNE